VGEVVVGGVEAEVFSEAKPAVFIHAGLSSLIIESPK
jgi:hypothetical protein